MKREVSMFGKNFKLVLALTALAWIVYTMPMVRAAFREASTIKPTITDINAIK